MNPQSSFQRKIIYLVAIGVLLVIIAMLAPPARRETKTMPGSPGGKLARLRAANDLSPAQLGEIDPTSEAIKLSTLGMRGVASLLLWHKANNYKMKKDFSNMAAAVEQITKLNPHCIRAWTFLAWEQSFNVSVQHDDFRDRYRWVLRGIDYLEEGMRYNQHEARLQWETGWYVQQKIGRSDEKKQFRRLFRDEDDFHLGRPWMDNVTAENPRDSWLVAKWWFEEAERVVDTDEHAKIQGKQPLIYRSNAPMCQMYYAATLEEEGTFGSVARQAWEDAAQEWELYGRDEITTSQRFIIRLKDGDVKAAKAKKLVGQLDNMNEGLRDTIYQEKLADLTDQQREALSYKEKLADLADQQWEALNDKKELESLTDQQPEAPDYKEKLAGLKKKLADLKKKLADLKKKLTDEEMTLAAEAERELEISHMDVAERIKGRTRRSKAIKLAREAMVAEKRAKFIRSYRSIVAYEEWKNRAEVEREQDTLDARKFCYDGDQHYVLAEFDQAKESYDKGFEHWRKVFDRHPTLLDELNFDDEIVELIQRYRNLLRELTGDPLPEDFILLDVWEEFGKQQ